MLATCQAFHPEEGIRDMRLQAAFPFQTLKTQILETSSGATKLIFIAEQVNVCMKAIMQEAEKQPLHRAFETNSLQNE